MLEHPGAISGDALEAKRLAALHYLPTISPIVPRFLYNLVAPLIGKQTSKDRVSQANQELTTRIEYTKQIMKITNVFQEGQLDKLNGQESVQNNPRWASIRNFVSQWGAGCFNFNSDMEHPLVVSASTDASGYFLLFSPKGAYYVKIKGPSYDVRRTGGTIGEDNPRLLFEAKPEEIYAATEKLEQAIPTRGLEMANGSSAMHNTVNLIKKDQRYTITIRSLLGEGETSLTNRRSLIGDIMAPSLQEFITTSELALLNPIQSA